MNTMKRCLVILSLLVGCLAQQSCSPGSSITTTSVTYSCAGEAGCCCNSVMYDDPNAGAGNWPDCAPDFECRQFQPAVSHPTAGTGLLSVNVCKKRTAPALQPLAIASTQPAYCRIDLATP